MGEAWKKHPELGALAAVECLRYLAETQQGTKASVDQWKRASRWYRERQAGRYAFYAREEAERMRMVDSLCDRRAALLTSPVDACRSQSELLAGGRLLVALLVSVADGASEAESHGFLDIEDLTPWDTWIACVPSMRRRSPAYLISWVPPAFLELAEAGIRVNCVDCLRWAVADDLQIPSRM